MVQQLQAAQAKVSMPTSSNPGPLELVEDGLKRSHSVFWFRVQSMTIRPMAEVYNLAFDAQYLAYLIVSIYRIYLSSCLSSYLSIYLSIYLWPRLDISCEESLRCHQSWLRTASQACFVLKRQRMESRPLRRPREIFRRKWDTWFWVNFWGEQSNQTIQKKIRPNFRYSQFLCFFLGFQQNSGRRLGWRFFRSWVSPFRWLL